MTDLIWKLKLVGIALFAFGVVYLGGLIVGEIFILTSGIGD